MNITIRNANRSLAATVAEGNTTIELKLLTKDEAVELRRELYNCVDYLDECIRYGEVWSPELNQGI